MNSNEEHFENILQKLTTISALKQDNYRNIKRVFKELMEISETLMGKLKEKTPDLDKEVEIEFTKVNEFEFHVKLSGDILVFVLQTNIVTLNPAHPVMQSEHVKSDPSRGYFGHIMIYNFLSDSIRYNRLHDPGYLVARIMVNHENNFFVEGVRQMNFLFTDLAGNTINSQWLELILEKSIITAMEIDLIAPNYPDIQNVTLSQKINNESRMGRGEKIGFQMSAMD